MPTISTKSKIEATIGYGAEVIFSGSTSQERDAVADEVRQRTGAVFIPPDFHPNVIIGQGTAALEFEDQVYEMISKDGTLSVHRQLSDALGNDNADENTDARDHKVPPNKQYGHLDAVITPCGGGGLLSGTATALYGSGTYVFGAEPSFQGADDVRRGLATGERITSVKSLTIADGLRTYVREIPWSVISDKGKVQGVYAVNEEQIKNAMRLLIERMKVFVEPSAAVGLAVCLFDEDFRALVQREGGEEGWDVGVILSGGNTTIEAIAKMFNDTEEKGEETHDNDGAKNAESIPG